jgi:hypothetical protein
MRKLPLLAAAALCSSPLFSQADPSWQALFSVDREGASAASLEAEAYSCRLGFVADFDPFFSLLTISFECPFFAIGAFSEREFATWGRRNPWSRSAPFPLSSAAREASRVPANPAPWAPTLAEGADLGFSCSAASPGFECGMAVVFPERADIACAWLGFDSGSLSSLTAMSAEWNRMGEGAWGSDRLRLPDAVHAASWSGTEFGPYSMAVLVGGRVSAYRIAPRSAFGVSYSDATIQALFACACGASLDAAEGSALERWICFAADLCIRDRDAGAFSLSCDLGRERAEFEEIGFLSLGAGWSSMNRSLPLSAGFRAGFDGEGELAAWECSLGLEALCFGVVARVSGGVEMTRLIVAAHAEHSSIRASLTVRVDGEGLAASLDSIFPLGDSGDFSASFGLDACHVPWMAFTVKFGSAP